jgi:hypothetical protein
MLLSLTKAAHADMSSAAWQENPGSLGMTKERATFYGKWLLSGRRFSSLTVQPPLSI